LGSSINHERSAAYLFPLAALADELERDIRSRKLLDLPAAADQADHWVYPYYDGLSIYNLIQSVGGLLGADMPHGLDTRLFSQLPQDVDRVIVLISDGLGYKLLQRLLNEEDALRNDVEAWTDGQGVVPLTSASPSTTACALPVFWTAQSPAISGMLGTSMQLPKVSTLSDMLRFEPVHAPDHTMPLENWGLSAKDFIPVPSLAEQLSTVGVPTHLLLMYSLFNTGLSRLLHRGIWQMHPHLGLNDLWMRLRDVLMQTKGQKLCLSVYVPNVDALSHAYGDDTPYLRAEIRQQMQQLRQLLSDPAVQDGRTLLLMTADHGHANATQVIDIDQDARFASVRGAMRGSAGGDERFLYLYLREGTSAAVVDELNSQLGDLLTAVPVETALQGGLFGNPADSDRWHPELRQRLGDVLVFARPGVRLTDTQRISPIISVHAGLSAAEMLVPLLWRRF
jgi:hypothetical protein